MTFDGETILLTELTVEKLLDMGAAELLSLDLYTCVGHPDCPDCPDRMSARECARCPDCAHWNEAHDCIICADCVDCRYCAGIRFGRGLRYVVFGVQFTRGQWAQFMAHIRAPEK